MALVLVATAVWGQETPVAEAVYGGRARDFAVGINDDDTFAPTVTMYMSTESANSVFFQNGTSFHLACQTQFASLQSIMDQFRTEEFQQMQFLTIDDQKEQMHNDAKLVKFVQLFRMS